MKRRVVHVIRDGHLCWVVQLRRPYWPVWRDEPGQRYPRQIDAVAAMLFLEPRGFVPNHERAGRLSI